MSIYKGRDYEEGSKGRLSDPRSLKGERPQGGKEVRFDHPRKNFMTIAEGEGKKVHKKGKKVSYHIPQKKYFRLERTPWFQREEKSSHKKGRNCVATRQCLLKIRRVTEKSLRGKKKENGCACPGKSRDKERPHSPNEICKGTTAGRTLSFQECTKGALKDRPEEGKLRFQFCKKIS